MKAKGAPKAKIMSGKVVDWVIIALTAVFALQHPAVKPYAYLERPVSELVSYTQEYARNTTVALQAPEGRKALFKSWFHYVIGSDIAGVGAGPEAADPKLQHFYQLNEWKNSLLLPQSVRDQVPHVAAIWLRNYVAIHLVYFGIGGLWAFVIYIVLADKFFPKDAKTGQRARPDWPAISEQVWVSMKAMPLYVMMPTIGEWLAERGWTRAYSTLEEVGGIEHYIMWTIVYVVFVEWCIYWIHRLLHEIRWLYLWLHYDHHMYNNKNDMSPFAGLAFHPLDGCAQASPYIVGLFLMPVHFWTHQALLFFTGVWTANIHDALKSGTEPVMGSKYHMYHHTAYRDNYGQFFVLFDWLHDTLTDPLDKDPNAFGLVEKGAPEAAKEGTMFENPTEVKKKA